MLIDEDYRKTTSFLYVDTIGDSGQNLRKPCGTVFFVYVEYAPNHADFYAVTARHVITQSYTKRVLHLRLSLQDGGYIDLELQNKDWIQHHATDVAIIPFSMPPNADVKALPSSYLANDEFIVEKKVGVGDEVFFIGLFTQHFGTAKPLPIIRFGNISLMPYEPVKITPEPGTTPIEIEAYLVEARSWGGQSGSPTFVHFPPSRHPGVITIPQWPLKEPLFRLLGLVSGHFDITKNVDFNGEFLPEGKVSHNAGIGVVIPAKYIQQLLDLEELQERRNKLKGQIENE